PLDRARDLRGGLRVERAGRLPRESGVCPTDATIAADVDACRKRVEILELRQLRAQILRLAYQQHGIRDVVLLQECLEAHGIRELSGLLEREQDDLESLIVILPVEIGEERRLVVAIRAPAAGQAEDYHLAAESGITERHRDAVQIG